VDTFSNWVADLLDVFAPPILGTAAAGAVVGASASAGNGNTDTLGGVAAGAATGAGDALGGLFDGITTLPSALSSLIPSGSTLAVTAAVIIVILLIVAYIAKEVDA
jgi:hypothetical protein